MNLKIISVLSIAILFFSSECVSLDKFRVGVSLGISLHETKSKSLIDNEKTKFKKTSHYAGIFGGYDHLITDLPIFIGLEGEIALHNAEREKYGDYYQTPAMLKIATNNSVVGSARLGVVAKNILVYGKLGLSSTNWKTTFEDQKSSTQKKYQKYGIVCGGGIECIMNNNFSFGLEYTTTNYNTIEKIPPELQLKLWPTIQVAKLRLIYSF